MSEKINIRDIKELNNGNIILLTNSQIYIIHKNFKNIFLNKTEYINLIPKIDNINIMRFKDDEFDEEGHELKKDEFYEEGQ